MWYRGMYSCFRSAGRDCEPEPRFFLRQDGIREIPTDTSALWFRAGGERTRRAVGQTPTIVSQNEEKDPIPATCCPRPCPVPVSKQCSSINTWLRTLW